jgi:hypothetical protein
VDFFGEWIGGGIGVSVVGSLTGAIADDVPLGWPAAFALGGGDVADATDVPDFAVMV